MSAYLTLLKADGWVFHSAGTATLLQHLSKREIFRKEPFLDAQDFEYLNKNIFNKLVNEKLIIKIMTAEEIEIHVQDAPREDLIRTAVSFLTNPNVQKSPVSQKEAFLKKKGLTTEEIKIAFEKSKLVTVPLVHQVHLLESAPSPVQVSWFQKIKDILNTLALLIGGAYGFYYLYKRFISPFLFGKPKKPKSLESSISSLNKTVEKSINELKNDVQQVQGDLKRVVIMQNEQQNNVKQISELKSEIATVKGILLSRHQFSSVNLSAASIPAWQLSRSSHKDDKESLENEDTEHNSGSSETEIVPNPNSNGGSQGSDSSLEMIKEVDS